MQDLLDLFDFIGRLPYTETNIEYEGIKYETYNELEDYCLEKLSLFLKQRFQLNQTDNSTFRANGWTRMPIMERDGREVCFWCHPKLKLVDCQIDRKDVFRTRNSGMQLERLISKLDNYWK